MLLNCLYDPVLFRLTFREEQFLVGTLSTSLNRIQMVPVYFRKIPKRTTRSNFPTTSIGTRKLSVNSLLLIRKSKIASAWRCAPDLSRKKQSFIWIRKMKVSMQSSKTLYQRYKLLYKMRNSTLLYHILKVITYLRKSTYND